MKTQKIKMRLGSDSYPVIIGEDILSNITKHIPKETTKIVLLTDQKLAKQSKKLIAILKKSSCPVAEIHLKAGEDLKSIQSVDKIYGKLIELSIDRNSLIIAFGGGTIGDVAGYVAATYMRGIKWIGVPTTLLAQVDSSIGGKTGINHKSGKNLIGAFHQPSLVLCDITFLKTLSKREYVSGLGEIIKYSLTFDKKFYSWICKHSKDLMLGKPKELIHAISKSAEWKCHVVAKDVKDRTGVREVLNFGHTFGHALEAATHYKKFQHGEAVIWGMRFATRLSVIKKHLSPKLGKEIDNLLASFQLPSIPGSIKKEVIFNHMKKDKKSEGKIIRFILLESIGSSVIDRSINSADLNQAYQDLFIKKKGK